MSAPVWTEDAIRALGTRTDLKTACSVAGLGYTNGKAMARNGTLPFPVYRVAHKYVVPVVGLLRLLLLDETPDMDEAEPASPATVTTDDGTSPRHAERYPRAVG